MTLIVIAVVGGVVAIVSNTLKKRAGRRSTDALGQQSLQASALSPPHPVAFSPLKRRQAHLPPSPATHLPQQYQPPHSLRDRLPLRSVSTEPQRLRRLLRLRLSRRQSAQMLTPDGDRTDAAHDEDIGEGSDLKGHRS